MAVVSQGECVKGHVCAEWSCVWAAVSRGSCRAQFFSMMSICSYTLYMRRPAVSMILHFLLLRVKRGAPANTDGMWKCDASFLLTAIRTAQKCLPAGLFADSAVKK